MVIVWHGYMPGLSKKWAQTLVHPVVVGWVGFTDKEWDPTVQAPPTTTMQCVYICVVV